MTSEEEVPWYEQAVEPAVFPQVVRSRLENPGERFRVAAPPKITNEEDQQAVRRVAALLGWKVDDLANGDVKLSTQGNDVFQPEDKAGWKNWNDIRLAEVVDLLLRAVEVPGTKPDPGDIVWFYGDDGQAPVRVRTLGPDPRQGGILWQCWMPAVWIAARDQGRPVEFIKLTSLGPLMTHDPLNDATLWCPECGTNGQECGHE